MGSVIMRHVWQILISPSLKYFPHVSIDSRWSTIMESNFSLPKKYMFYLSLSHTLQDNLSLAPRPCQTEALAKQINGDNTARGKMSFGSVAMFPFSITWQCHQYFKVLELPVEELVSRMRLKSKSMR